MPIQKCSKDGKKNCWRWGQHGTCYCGRGAKQKAIRQAAAAFSNGYRGKGAVDEEFIKQSEEKYSQLSPLQKRLVDILLNCEMCKDDS